MNTETHFENVKSTVDYNVARYLGVLRDRPDRSEWITPASVVNAFYSPEHNSICKTPFCFLFYDKNDFTMSTTFSLQPSLQASCSPRSSRPPIQGENEYFLLEQDAKQLRSHYC